MSDITADEAYEVLTESVTDAYHRAKESSSREAFKKGALEGAALGAWASIAVVCGATAALIGRTAEMVLLIIAAGVVIVTVGVWTYSLARHNREQQAILTSMFALSRQQSDTGIKMWTMWRDADEDRVRWEAKYKDLLREHLTAMKVNAELIDNCLANHVNTEEGNTDEQA